MRVQGPSSYLFLFCLLFLFGTGNVFGKWEKFENCRLVPHGSNDGDSFRVKTYEGRQFQFRLYFVDTPELGLFYPDRVEAQARYFGVSVQRVLRVGEDSSAFTKQFLSGGTFTVWTEWKDAWGSQTRYAALVYREEESLIEELVKNGLVRVHGFKNNSRWPGGWDASEYRERLLEIESKAKHQRIGAWGGSQLVVDDPLLKTAVEEQTNGAASKRSSPLVDLNSANAEALEGLPGIGPVLAERIVTQRPFDSVNALEGVKGIGDGLLSKLRPLVFVTFAEKPFKTAAFYLADPSEWNGREIELSISNLNRVNKDGPEGFVRLQATTAFDGKKGGVIPLYLKREFLVVALNYFGKTNRALVLRVRFFQYKGEWVTVYRNEGAPTDSVE